MKTLKAFIIFLICIVFLFSSTSCVVLVSKDNGLHKGWFKNPHNPHNPQYNKQQKSKGNSKK